MKQSLIFSACSLVLFIVGCKGTVEVNCTDEPTRRSCVEACADDPTLSHCSPGEDAGPDARMVDAGPDVPSSNCTTPCEGDTPICDEDNSVCVQCLLPADCEGVEGRPMCVDNACVECTGNEECTEPGASVCSTAGDTAGTCVPCAAATGADDCAGVVDGETALNVCDESGDAGVCVQCNAGDESACDTNVCDVVAKACTDMPANGLNLCDECVSDRQCMGELACVQETFAGEATGFRCTWPRDAATGPDGSCSTVPPFIGDNTEVIAIGGGTVSVCQLRATTCASLQDYESTNCMSLDEEGDARCGLPEVDDGFCQRVDDATNLCTHACEGPRDCATGTCPFATPRVCVFP